PATPRVEAEAQGAITNCNPSLANSGIEHDGSVQTVCTHSTRVRSDAWFGIGRETRPKPDAPPTAGTRTLGSDGSSQRSTPSTRSGDASDPVPSQRIPAPPVVQRRAPTAKSALPTRGHVVAAARGCPRQPAVAVPKLAAPN